ncbi:MAG: serine/threonine protein kinase [Gemmatimonadales bacterium]|nr:serine/threonine protein kinase [Gemmatimonadales bacterium]
MPATPPVRQPSPAPASTLTRNPDSESSSTPADVAERNRYSTLTGQTLDGRYRILRRVGEGGMSFVYQGEEIGTGRGVALKVLTPRLSRDPGSVERLKREASIAMRFDHPNVCPILRVSQTTDRTLYLVMPFLSGEALSDYEARKGRLSVEEGLPILAQACRGLQHAHDLGIVHRDLKPENIMLVPDEHETGGLRAVVMDFGLAKQRRAGPDVAKLTQTGIVLGTPEFMSPEQIRGKVLDGRSDVYAMGVLAYEMFTGQLPFTGKNAQETMLARLRSQAPAIRSVRAELPARLDAIIARALQLQPTDRQGSMDELAHAFEAANQGSTSVIARLFGKT